MKSGFKVIDAEMHLQEPVDFFERRLPEPYKSQFKVTPPPAGLRIGPHDNQVLDRMLAERGLTYARGLAPSTHRVSINGELVPRPAPWVVVRHALRHWPEVPLMAEANRRCEPEVYLEGMDIEGIDVGILTPTLTFLVLRHDQLPGPLANAICRAYNDWAAEFCASNPARFKFWGFVAPHDAELAAEEARRCMEQLGAAGVATIQGAINGNLWSDALFDPLWRELDRLPYRGRRPGEGQPAAALCRTSPHGSDLQHARPGRFFRAHHRGGADSGRSARAPSPHPAGDDGKRRELAALAAVAHGREVGGLRARYGL
jgi:hypothetical protein